MLHIHNGDSSANTLKRSAIPGEHVAFREALIAGPAPFGFSGEDWLKARATHLSEAYGIDLQACERDLLNQEAALSAYHDHEEVILWFEHDLYCQTHLLYLLNWFARQELGETKLSLICIGEFPGIRDFRGLGQLSSDQLASLFNSRHEVTAPEIELATAAWRAYSSPDPTAIELLLEGDTSALPFLRVALGLHLARFPSRRNGLGRIENRGLQLIHSGLNAFVQLFPRFGAVEPIYGLGDFQFWLTIKQLSNAKEPLVTMKGSNSGRALTSDKVRETYFEITGSGIAVLNGEADFVEMNGIDLWLGGVHLSAQDNLWRWDEDNQKLISGEVSRE